MHKQKYLSITHSESEINNETPRTVMVRSDNILMLKVQFALVIYVMICELLFDLYIKY